MTAPVSPIKCPFTVLIDTNESQPFTFQGLRADADKLSLPIVVPCRRSCLGRYPDSLGDYSIDGLVGRVAIERKSMEDVWGTVLGWESDFQKSRNLSGRRERFKHELANLAAINRASDMVGAIVVVEASEEQCVDEMPEWGAKEQAENRKIFFRSCVSWQQRYLVPWKFCSSRRSAEVYAFRWLEKFWQHLPKREQQAAIERSVRI